jgi:hypothetical protein
MGINLAQFSGVVKRNIYKKFGVIPKSGFSRWDFSRFC